MLTDSKAFSGFSVTSLTAAKEFYTNVLGVKVDEGDMGYTLKLGGGLSIFMYEKTDHTPATFTILNFPVDNIDEAMADLGAKGVTFEHYDGLTDDSGVARGIAANQGPDIAWFKDPSGNILSVLQEAK